MNVTLIGMPGAGKSSVGKRLARSLGYRFVDCDEVVERKLGMRLEDAKKTLGERAVMKAEEEAAVGLCEKGLGNCLIATGGSVVYSDAAMKALREVSVVVFLDSPLDVLKRNVGRKPERGIFWHGRNGLEELNEERGPLYWKNSEIRVLVEREARPSEIARLVKSKLEKGGYLESGPDKVRC